MLPSALIRLVGLLTAGVPLAAASPIDLYFHADVDGQLAVPACGRVAKAPPDYAALLGALEHDRAGGSSRATLALLGANAIAPDLFTRRLFAADAAGAAAALATLFKGARYGAFTIGSRELSAEPDWVLAYVRAMDSAGVPLVLSNVSCAPDASAPRAKLCGVARPHVLLDVAGIGQVGVVATLSPRLTAGIEATNRQGLSFEDPLAAITRETAALRRQGAARVVVMTEVTSDRDGLEELRVLQNALAALPSPPDAVLSAGLADGDGGRPIRLLRQDDAPIVAGSTSGTRGITRVTLTADAVAEVSVIASDVARADAGATSVVAGWSRAFCEQYGTPLGPRVRGTITRDELVTYVLEVMRRATGAEVAVINDKLVKAAPFPLTGALTAGELAQAFPYRAVLGTARLGGTQLGALVGGALANPKLRAVGLTNGDGGVKVNGRPLDGTRQYLVATIAFLAHGGDGIFPTGTLPWRALPGEPDVGQVVRDFLLKNAGAEDGDPTIDPSTDFGPPASRRLLVVALTDAEVAVADTSISNGPDYTDSQLARAQQTSLKVDWSSLLQTRAPAAEMDARLRLQYGWARTVPAGQPAVSAETLDLLTGSVTYNDRKLRHALWERPGAAIPDPYARVMLESELTRPEVTPTQTRDYHHAELTATVGAIFAPASKLRLRLGPGVRKELLAEGAPGRWRSVIEAGLTLDQIALATVGALAVRFDATTDYVLIEPAGARQQQLRASAHLSVPLMPLLFITIGADVYAAEYAPLGWASSADTTVGLRVHFDAAHQRL